MSERDDVTDEMKASFIVRPLFWSHVWGVLAYPVRIMRFRLAMRRIDRMFGRQRVLALAPVAISSEAGRRLVQQTERETRIQAQ